jgi:DNA-binding NtrC family response regulator
MNQERKRACMGVAVLFVSPHHADAAAIATILRPTALRLDHAATLQDARRLLFENSYGAILTEAQLPDGAWTDVMELTFEARVFPAVIVTHPLADDRFWAEVLNLGAYDLLAQPFDQGEVRRILSHACAQTSLKPLRSECA